MQMPKYTPAFPKEMQRFRCPTRQLRNGEMVGFFILDQHLGLDTIEVQSLHQSVGSHCGTTRLLAGVHNKNAHVYRFDSDVKVR